MMLHWHDAGELRGWHCQWWWLLREALRIHVGETHMTAGDAVVARKDYTHLSGRQFICAMLPTRYW